jgi:Tfp pilus assembly protein PilZ
MSPWNGIDRRKFPRVNYPCLVIVRHDGGKQEVFLTHTENLGIGGICIILKKNIKLFTNVEVELDLLDLSDHVKCKGKVVWSIRRKSEAPVKPLFYDLGIEFSDLNKKDQDRIQEIVSRLASKGMHI